MTLSENLKKSIKKFSTQVRAKPKVGLLRDLGDYVCYMGLEFLNLKMIFEFILSNPIPFVVISKSHAKINIVINCSRNTEDFMVISKSIGLKKQVPD